MWDHIVFVAFDDWLKVVAPHLVLAGCIEAMKTALSSYHTMVALAYKRCSRQHLDSVYYAYQRHNTHLCAGYGHRWDVAPQVQGNPLTALGCELETDR